jgi:hypothetical protein
MEIQQIQTRNHGVIKVGDRFLIKQVRAIKRDCWGKTGVITKCHPGNNFASFTLQIDGENKQIMVFTNEIERIGPT